jgi:hypothetical protein
VTREKASHIIAVTDTDEDWSGLLAEIDRSAADGRAPVRVTLGAPGEMQISRVASVITRGYSIDHAEAEHQVVLAPKPGGVLYLVSELDDQDAAPQWLPGVEESSFRQFLLGTEISAVRFAEMASNFPGECWHLDTFMGAASIPEFVMEFVASREIDVVQIVDSRFGLDLLPALRFSYPRLRAVMDVGLAGAQGSVLATYATSRYGNLVDAFHASDPPGVELLSASFISPWKIQLLPQVGDTAGSEALKVAHRDTYGRLIASLVA